MAQSLAKIIVHIAFSTKNRRPMILPDLRERMAAYLVGILKQVDSPSIETNCVADHVHVLCRLSRTRTLADVIEEVKTGSSKWAKTQGPELRDFYWQAGYGAFSVSQSNVDDVREYIRRQEEHHRRFAFQDEFRELLKRHQVEYDERYVWD
jgi:REP element-mobilizing transposase RayT